MRSADDLSVWERLDDVIMGGQSDSALRPAEGGGEPSRHICCLVTLTYFCVMKGCEPLACYLLTLGHSGMYNLLSPA